ncbi:MAG TPA: 2-oxoacid:acceptor oxidoreductase subunit alpha [bacterium]|nr:2-oxoacid:acceptor oxidoreductase subunit alpha [bacterium]
MKANPRSVLEGMHFLDGDHAAAEGALAAGADFSAGYPITPSTEVVERLAQRFPRTGGTFIQMEDELAASIAIQGAVWGGAKAITVTSGPGFSLMMEHLGYGIMTETPFVLVDVQRGGPSTGLPTLPAQSDMMQARWGSHGDYEIIALAPSSPQECFDLTIRAFNLSEKYRTPVLLMMDECVGHMLERVVIPPADQIELEPRRMTSKKPGEEFWAYELDESSNGSLVPPMTKVGLGHFPHVTGLTHDERGYPAMNAAAQTKLVERLIAKIRDHRDEIIELEEDGVEDADIIVVSYGITARVCHPAIARARREGRRVGLLRLITVWPFAGKRIAELAARVKGFVVPEMNMGQMVREVERAVAGRAPVRLVPNAGGEVHDPEVIYRAIIEVAK